MNEKNRFLADYAQDIGAQLIRMAPLSIFTSFRIGGPAELIIRTGMPDILEKLLNKAKELEINPHIIGGGTNILAPDRGIKRPIFLFRADENDKISGGLCPKLGENYENHDEGFFRLLVPASLKLDDLIQFTLENSLTGLEFLTGIPGLVGGAIAGNAGAFGDGISSFIDTVDLWLPEEGRKIVKSQDMGFEYRYCQRVAEGARILAATFILKRGKEDEIRAKYQEYLDLRRDKHPGKKVPCAGCFFKNPPPPAGQKIRVGAGKYLDQAGLKGMTIGGAKIWEGHANFIINQKDAKSEEVIKLAEIMARKVQEKHGILLEREVRILAD